MNNQTERPVRIYDLLLLPLYLALVMLGGCAEMLLSILFRSYNLLLKGGKFSGERLFLLAQYVDLASQNSPADNGGNKQGRKDTSV